MNQPHSLPLIIIGTGLAGFNLAKEWRKLNSTSPLVLITQDDGHFYSKPQLSNALLQGKTPQNLIINDCDKMAEQLKATILTHSTVIDLDPQGQTIQCQTLEGLKTLAYHQLVFAQGAIPKPLPLFDALNHHYRINNLVEYTKFIAAKSQFEHLTLIGSGLVGCEFAHDLAQTSLNLSIITPDPFPLTGLVPSIVGKALQGVLSSKGIQWHTQTQVQKVAYQNGKIILGLSGAIELQTNAILSAIGLSPNIALAQKANIQTEHGIVVDDFLSTNIPHIFALGDCAQIQGKCRFYVAPLLQCARTLAQTLCGNPVAISFMPTPISLKVSSYPMIIYPPPIDIEGDWHFEQSENNIKSLFRDEEGNLQGYVLSGSYIELRQQCLKELQVVSI